MRRAALALALMAAVPEGTLAAGKATAAAAGAPAPRRRASTHRATPRPTLDQARAALKALMRDRARRRFRHHWERAIAALNRAARGKDAPAALLEAARARYALYRWSADESDREQALRLAARAAKLGSREAPGLAGAIRREAGDDRPDLAAGTAKKGAPRKLTAGSEPAEDEPAPEPALEAAVADLSAEKPAEPLPFGSSGGEGPAKVSQVKAWSSGDYTRVAIYLSHWVGWQKLELAPEDGRPRRLALDLRPALLETKALSRAMTGAKVDRVRAAQKDAETVRVVLDLPGAEALRAFGLDDPPRLIVDVGRKEAPRSARAPAPEEVGSRDGGEPAAAAEERAAKPRGGESRSDREEEAPAEAPERGPVHRIVVDAGHGGHDPGAIGPTRLKEKDVTLSIAHRLARKLRAEGFEVLLTRTADRYLALEERTAIANTARGDLFVSVHANANPRRTRTGVETYFLNVTDDRYAARLAARENGLDPAEESRAQVQRILTDFEAKSSATLSRRLALDVQREICSAVRAHVGDVTDLGVKSALFYVLLGARMPAVLVETAFISSRAEERRLASPRYQDEVAGAIARAISGFAGRPGRVAAR